jgi:hypothetical protein
MQAAGCVDISRHEQAALLKHGEQLEVASCERLCAATTVPVAAAAAAAAATCWFEKGPEPAQQVS